MKIIQRVIFYFELRKTFIKEESNTTRGFWGQHGFTFSRCRAVLNCPINTTSRIENTVITTTSTITTFTTTK